MPRFSIKTTTTDTDGNFVQETNNVQAGPVTSGIPEVSYSFPKYVITTEGGVGGPTWGAGNFQGFAFIKVTPTPRNNGTGAFYVQHYYDSGNYPNNPDRRFEDTFRGVGSTIDQQWFFSTTQLDVDGGGVGTSGFANSVDWSGLRQAIIISQDTQSIPGPSDDGLQTLDPTRYGGRVLDTDGIFAAYNHDTTSNILETLKVFQKGKTVAGGSTDRTSWPDDSFIFFHPYHYVPVYQNNTLLTEEKLPYVLVLEDGTQNIVKGTVDVSGTSVTGSYTEFLTDISGTYQDQAAIQFEGNDTWYLVSGVLSNSGLVIYDYGDNPQLTDVGASVNYYSIGSGLVSVLPDLSGCDSWDVEITPRYNDNDPISTETITYTANINTITSPGPSGTLSYEWVITTEAADGSLSTSGSTGSTVTVDYSDDLRKNVEVTVSGSGQPSCIHSDETGLIDLNYVPAAGTWSPRPIDRIYYNTRRGALPPIDYYFHHWNKRFTTPKYKDYEFLETFGDTVKIDSTFSSKIPDQGSILFQEKDIGLLSGPSYGLHWGTYSSKTDTTLEGVRWRIGTETGEEGDKDPNSGDIRPLGSFTISKSDYVIAYQNVAHWPMTYVVSKSSDNKTLVVEDTYRIADARDKGQKKFWILPAGAGPQSSQFHGVAQVVELLSVNHETNEMTFNETIQAGFGLNGHQIIPCPHYHWRNVPFNDTGGTGNKSWNTLEMSLLQTLAIIESDGVVDTSDLATDQTKLLYNNVPAATREGGDQSISASTYNLSLHGEPATYDVINSKQYTIWMYEPLYFTNQGHGVSLARNKRDVLIPIRVPYRSQLIIPDKNRDNNAIFSYASRDIFRQVNGDVVIRFNNCQLLNTTSLTIKNRGISYIHKIVDTEQPWIVDSTAKNQPTLSPFGTTGDSIGGAVREQFSVHNAYVWNDWIVNMTLIQANQTAPTSDINSKVGSKSSAQAEPIWEKILNGYQDGTIFGVDPIYIQRG